MIKYGEPELTSYDKALLKAFSLEVKPNQNLIDAFKSMNEANKDWDEHNKKVGR